VELWRRKQYDFGVRLHIEGFACQFFSVLGTSHKMEVIDLRGQSADSKNQLLVGHLVDRDSMECIQQRFREESSTFGLPCSLPSAAC